LCLYSHAVDTGQAGRAYDHEDAERFARALLMPAEVFAPIVSWSDFELAELFTAPMDQVAARRRDGVAR
jgi:hypothetical protein